MWIKLHHKLLKWEWFPNPEMVQMLVYLLLNANYEDGNYQGIPILRGQLITTLPKLQSDLRQTLRQTRTQLERLKKTGEIVIKTTNKYSLITICNYDDYQCRESDERQTNDKQNDRQTTDKRQTERQSNDMPIYTEYTELQNISTSNAHTYEDNLTACFYELSASRIWLDDVLLAIRNLGYKQVTDLSEYLKTFFSKLRAEGETFKTTQDAKHHFFNWLKNHLKEEQKNEINRTNNQSRKQEANQYLLDKFVANYSRMEEQIPKPF
jgi:hypothetical protein